MICVIAGNYHEALQWAKGQEIPKEDWFYPNDESDLHSRKDFHVIVIGTAGMNTPPMYFEKIWRLAKLRGKIK